MKSLKLVQPLQIGIHTLRNRMIMPAVETRLSNMDGSATDRFVDWYGARAKGGAAMVIVENSFVDNKSSRSSLVSSGISSDHHIASKYLVAQAIKEQGAVAILQLSHGGRQARKGATAFDAVAPSNVPCKVTQRTPHVLSIEEIVAIEDAFADAAERAQLAQFDGIEIHGAHGYLICSFLSPYTNKRTDAYGGTPEKRGTFARNIIRKIRERVGKNFIVGYRISGEEGVEGGLTIEETTAFAKSIENDVDYMNVSGGNYETMATKMIAPLYIPQGYLIDAAAKMKATLSIPVIAVGGLDAELGEKVLAENKADLIAYGRALIADPDLPNKVMEGRLDDIKPCMRGHEGCISLFFDGCPIRCEVNPQAGREKEYAVKKTENPRNVVVIGGGPAGMEAARLADEMGHKVTLFEKNDHLGGRFAEATVPHFKEEPRRVLHWLIRQLEKSTVEVNMNQVISRNFIKAMRPDVVIVATGSDYIRLPIKGMDYAIPPNAVLTDLSKAKGRIAIIGGGLIGSELALHLAQNNRQVGVFEMREAIAIETEPLSQTALSLKLAEKNVDIFTSARVLEITPNSVRYSKDGKDEVYHADTFIYATGLRSHPTDEFDDDTLAPQVFKIGDAVRARKIFYCFNDAWFAVRNIK